VTEVPFSAEEESNGGNLPYEQAVDLLTRSAQVYWERTFPKLADGRNWEPLRVTTFDPSSPPACEGREETGLAAFYCGNGDYVAFDGRELGPTLTERIGDFAIGMLLGDLFAQAAQERRGVSTQGRDGQLGVDCLAGSWTNDLLERGDDQGAEVRLSAGDLDEAVTALLVFGRSAESSEVSAFDRIAKFRSGVLQGLPGCTG
jgi:predicted metalloprotease